MDLATIPPVSKLDFVVWILAFVSEYLGNNMKTKFRLKLLIRKGLIGFVR